MSAPSTAAAGENDVSVGEEGIMVAIRMRPLNSRESANNTADSKSHRVWRVLQKYNSVTQCTPEGKPLPERINGRNFFTYDRTFGEGSTTRQVYDEVAKGIVGSVTNGLNGTIFAYGQTSSGKTYTMQGTGSLESISNLNTQGGIVHMAASDIFSHIERDTERVFLVRVSFIEIYNEEVRDLLVSGGDDNTLSVREDPRRGVFVNSNETIVTGLDSLLSVLFAGEKNRSVASTGMNERSSRSHTIFRITVESRLKSVEKDEDGNSDDEMEEDFDDNELGNGNGAVRVSTLNLVDLAGSESVRHTGATGDRQKEGGKINQSLLTLSRVIGSLGQNATHINFRDSKLTRILQPSLSGNARMAVICCATPSELYLEETRSTLQFASRAKLVKTRAQVNEVLDDRSLIKKLQRELKEARDAGSRHLAMEQMKALEEKAAYEGEAKRKAEQDLKRMKELILKGGVLPINLSFNGAGKSSLFKSLFVYNDAEETINKPEDRAVLNSPTGDRMIPRVQAKTEIKPKKPRSAIEISTSHLTGENDIGLLRKALAAKSAQTFELKSKLSHAEDQTKSIEEKLQQERGEKEILRLAKQDLEYQVTALASDKEFVMTEQSMIMMDKDDEITNYLYKIEHMLGERKEQAQNVMELNALVESLHRQMEGIKNDYESEVKILNQEHDNELIEVQSEVKALRTQINVLKNEHMQQMQIMQNEHLSVVRTIREGHDSDLAQVKSEVDTLRRQIDVMTREHELEVETINKEHSNDLSDAKSEVLALRSQIILCQLTDQLKKADLENAASQVELAEKAEHLQDVCSRLEGALETNATLQCLVNELKSTVNAHEEGVHQVQSRVESLQAEIESVNTEKIALLDQLKELQEDKSRIDFELAARDQSISELNAFVEGSTNKLQSLTSRLESVAQENILLQAAKETSEAHLARLNKALSDIDSSNTQQLAELSSSLQQSQNKLSQATLELESLKSQLCAKESANFQLTEMISIMKNEHEAMSSEKDNLLALKDIAVDEAASLKASYSRLEGFLATEKSMSETLTRKLENAEGEVGCLSKEITILSRKNEKLETQLLEINNQKDLINNDVVTMKATISDLELKLVTCARERGAALAELEELQSENRHSAEILNKVTSKIPTLEERILELQTQNDDLQAQCATSNQIGCELQEKAKRLESEVLSSTTTINELRSQKEDANAKISWLMSENEKAQQTAASLNDATSELTVAVKLKAEVISRLQLEKETFEYETGNLKANNLELREQIHGLSQRLVESNAEVTSLKSSLKQMRFERDECNRKLEEIFSEKDAMIDVLNGQISECAQQLESANAERNIIVEKLEAATSNFVTLQNKSSSQSSKIIELESLVMILTSEKDTAETRLRELLSANEGSVEIVASLQSEKAALVARVDDCIARLDTEKEAAQSCISSLNASITELKAINAKLNNELSRAKSEIGELLSIAEKSEADYKSLLSEREECLKELEDAIGHKENFAAKISEMEARHRNEIVELRLMYSVAPSTSDSESIDSLRCEINELRTLLSSANDSVEDARSAALEADQELEQKELQLEQALRDLAEAEEKVRSLESLSREGRINSDSEEELLKDMELLMNEKLEAESRLETELKRRKEFEDELHKAAEEEKQLLMAEAEEKMVLLRDEISQLRSDLSRVESELYSAKDEVEDLRDQNQRSESKVHETALKITAITNELNTEREAKLAIKQELNQLHEESNSFKSQVFAAKASLEAEAQSKVEVVETKLSDALANFSASQREIKMLRETIEDLTSDIEEYKIQMNSMKDQESNEYNMETSRLREELAKAKVELSTLTADYHSAKNEVAAAKEKIAQVKKREHEKQIALAQKAKDSIEQLQDRLRTAETKAKEASQLSNGSNEELKSLKAQLEEVNSSIREKDMRIAHLEKTKMTKQQVEKIRKIQEERVRYMTEAKDYKQRVEELETEMASNSSNSKPRRYALRERTELSKSEEENDVARLNDELKQCNLKLRKYVQHSERLEKERNGVMAVISSCNVEDIVGNSLEEMVASLCKKLSSIEEECDVLANSEDRAAGYLADLDSLREKYSHLEGQLQFYKKTYDELSTSHEDCKVSLQKAQEKIAALKKDKESLQASHVSAKGNITELQSEQRRQMQWLEKENLQLGDELKKTKQELLQTKTELDSVQNGLFGNDEATEELFGLSNILKSSSRLPLVPPKKTIPSGNKTSEKKRSLSVPIDEFDKENLLNSSSIEVDMARSPFTSAKKQRKSVNPFSSVKKASRKITKAISSDDSPKHFTLGEENEQTGELTSDCKQS
ncbi:hypothetical protein ACHAWX_005043 [Stephanocyclus meneghinianus]